MILSIFNCEKSSGCIYIEAYNMSHVKQIVNGMSGIYQKGIEMIPYKEMTQLLKVCSEIDETSLQPHQWIRIKSGPYKGDLGIIEHVEGSQRALVKLIPRIQTTIGYDGETKLNLIIKQQDLKNLELVSGSTVPQKLFNPQHVKNECIKQRFEPLGKSFFIWKEQMFRNGFLYLYFKVNKLVYDKVGPRLEEVQRFQKNQNSLDDFLSDQDEWDIMDDKTLVKTIRNDGLSQLEVGDRVEVVNRQLKGMKGVIIKIDSDDFVHIQSLDKVPFQQKVKAKEVLKYFERGESVRVISGTHSGDSGIIAAIDGKHAIVTMDGGSRTEELKILLSNLKLKKEEMEHVKLRDYIEKSIMDIKYQAGELILYNSNSSLAYVIQVYPEYLKVLNSRNQIEHIKHSSVQRKVFHKRNQYALDKNHNTIASRSLVIILDRSHLNVIHKIQFVQNKIGEVKGFYKECLFVYIIHHQKQTNGIYAVNTKNVLNAGQEFVKNVQQKDHQGYILAQIDRRQKDRKMSRSYVVINQGQYKGLKAKVLFADDNLVKVEITSNNMKVQLPRLSVTEIRDPTMPLEAKNIGCEAKSFDEAAKLDMGADEERSLFEAEEDKVGKFDCYNDAQMTPKNDDKEWGDCDDLIVARDSTTHKEW
ncbi:transcription elongation factor spt5 [Stylonychia lemnae]|uniref:Transcription elongation factor spt5 n=1 Tax=Stylonychia lemnae TaxID=5949 RepID=A0A078A420_STYLE|nr:transcription elongation factor spt5 [Stylonychia lemnae]|eukprot:CDW77018.1 transcription elongation factor spt5 [Stylonychia lemnae]